MYKMTSYFNIITWSFYSLSLNLSSVILRQLFPSLNFFISSRLWKSLSICSSFTSFCSTHTLDSGDLIFRLLWRIVSVYRLWRLDSGNASEMTSLFPFHLFVSRTFSRIIFNIYFYSAGKCDHSNKSRS